jgi:hypothetical protein
MLYKVHMMLYKFTIGRKAQGKTVMYRYYTYAVDTVMLFFIYKADMGL